MVTTRKGYSTSVFCNECGHVFLCEKCGVALVMHKEVNSLKCRYCGEKISIPETCPKCSGVFLTGSGLGVEKVDMEIRKNFRDASVERVDTDIITKDSERESSLKKFAEGKTDIIVGTQFAVPYLRHLKKGVVIIVGFEYLLGASDYRSSEEAVNFILGIADLAGEGVRIIIQARTKENPLLDRIIKGDLGSFWKEELKSRQELMYPPYYRLALISSKDKDGEKASCLLESLKKIIEVKIPGAVLLGPVFINSIGGYGNYQLLLKSKESPGKFLKESVAGLKSGEKFNSRNIDIEIY